MDELVVGRYYYVSNSSIEDVLQQKKAGRIFNRRKCTSIRGKFKLDNGVYRYMKYWKRAVGEENKGMKIEDVKIGMKVVPHSKNGMFPGEGLENSNEWGEAVGEQQPYFYVNSIERDIVVCNAEKIPFKSGDFFLASDLTPYEEKYVCNIPGVTTDFVPGKEYWISDISEQDAVEAGCVRTYVVTIGGKHRFVGSDHIGTSDYPNEEFTTTTWKYAVDPDTYKEPETEMTVEEVAEALRSKGVITGKLKIKE